MLTQLPAAVCECPVVPPVTVTPEPATITLLGVGLALLLLVAWRRRRVGRGAALLGLLVASAGAPGVLRASDDVPCVCPPPTPPPTPGGARDDDDGFPAWAVPIGLGALVGTGWMIGGGEGAALPAAGPMPGGPLAAAPGGAPTAAPSAVPTPAPLPSALVAPAPPADDAPEAAPVAAGAGPVGSGPALASFTRRPAPYQESDGLVPPNTAQGLLGAVLAGVAALGTGVALLRRRRRD